MVAEAENIVAQLSELENAATALQTETEEMKAETEKLLADMDKQTKRIMRDLGVNLRIVHRDTNFGSLYTDFVAADFPFVEDGRADISHVVTLTVAKVN